MTWSRPPSAADGHGHVLGERAGRRGDAVVAAPLTRGALAAAGHAVGGLQLERDRGQRRQLLVLLGRQLVGVLLLRHADRADPLRVEELPDDRLLRGQQHLAGSEHRQVAVVEQPDVVGHRARGVDVVGDDEEGRVDLRVEVYDELVEERRADRVETGVRHVEEHDLRVEHQRPGQAGALAHAARDLTGQLVLGAEEADEVHLLHHDLVDLGLGLPRVLAQREGDVVVEVHRAEHRAVLEEDAEELSDLVELLLGAGRDVGALDEDRALVRLEQPDQGLEEDRLAGARRAEHHADLAGRHGERHVAPDELLAERLAQVLDLDLNAHDRLVPPSSPRTTARSHRLPVSLTGTNGRGRPKLRVSCVPRLTGATPSVRSGRAGTMGRKMRRGAAHPVGWTAPREERLAERHLRVTVAPAASRTSLAFSAASLVAFSRTAFGALSTSSLASFRPREVRPRTSLMTLIFLSPADSRTTSNSSWAASSPPPAAAAPPAAGAAATATGAAAVTPKVSSNCFTNSLSSISVISLNASRSSSVLSFAMMAFPSIRWSGSGWPTDRVSGGVYRADPEDQASVASAAGASASAAGASSAGASVSAAASGAASSAGASSAATGVPAPPARIEGSCSAFAWSAPARRAA